MDVVYCLVSYYLSTFWKKYLLLKYRFVITLKTMVKLILIAYCYLLMTFREQIHPPSSGLPPVLVGGYLNWIASDTVACFITNCVNDSINGQVVFFNIYYWNWSLHFTSQCANCYTTGRHPHITTNNNLPLPQKPSKIDYKLFYIFRALASESLNINFATA